jgi:CubicO group peptidase (beta-lactamase class C family)
MTIMNRNRSRVSLAIPLLSLLAAAAGGAVLVGTPSPRPAAFSLRASKDYQAVIAAFRESIPKRMEEKKVPGLALAVVTDHEVLWLEGFGFTDYDRTTSVTPETRFSVQSMSKNLTAAAVLAAVCDGLVDLDAPITDYLPWFTVNSRFEEHPERRMTLRLLLSHRAGFTHEAPDGSNYEQGSGSFESHVRSIARTWLRFPVDQRYAYSNLGIDLAGYILQVRSGRPFADYARRKILAPAGMMEASFDLENIRKDPARAIGHVPNRRPVPLDVPMLAAGGLYVGAADMARWVQFHLNEGKAGGRRILDRALLREMAEIPAHGERQTNGYGLGLAVVPYAGTTLLTHSGGGYGFQTYMGWLPELKLGVVCLTNATGHDLNTRIANELLAAFIAAGAGSKPLPAAADPASIPLPPEVEIPSAVQARLAGQYLSTSGGWMNIEFKDGRIGVAAGSEFRPGRFVSPDEVVFFSGGRPLFYRFVRNPEGVPARIVRLYDGETFDSHASPAEASGPAKPEWEAYVGKYGFEVDGLPGGTHSVSLKNGYLYLDSFKLAEHRPGLFFSAHGEALDLSGGVPTWRNIRLTKVKAAD